MKECPDLTKMTLPEKESFWSETDPLELKSLADRLLAESLPQNTQEVDRIRLSEDFRTIRQELGWTPEALAERLGINAELVLAWEYDQVKTPESFPFLLRRLITLHKD